MHPVLAFTAAGRRRGHRVVEAIDADKFQWICHAGTRVIDGTPRRITQIAVYRALRLVLPKAERIRRAHGRRKVVGKLHLAVLLHGVIDAGRTDNNARIARGIDIAIDPGAIDHSEGAGTRRRSRLCRRVAERLRVSVVVEVVEVQPERPVARLVADRDAAVLAVEWPVGPVHLEVLAEHIQLCMRLELLWHVRADDHHSARRIARIKRRERTIDDIDAIDLLRCHHSPARRRAETVVEKIGDQQVIGIDHRLRAGDGAIHAHDQNAVAIADVAFADMNAGQILQHRARSDGVDAFVDLFGRDAFDGVWQVGWNRRFAGGDEQLGQGGRRPFVSVRIWRGDGKQGGERDEPARCARQGRSRAKHLVLLK